MKVAFPVIAISICFLLYSCRSDISALSILNATNYNQPDSISISVTAMNLTEDMSSVSSQNDEILLLVLNTTDSSNISTVFVDSFILTKKANEKRNSWYNQLDLVNTVFSILIIERDNDEKPNLIEETIRENYTDIKNFYTKNGNFRIEQFIGDNDIVGIKTIKFGPQDNIEFVFRGFFKLDKYEYNTQLTKIFNIK